MGPIQPAPNIPPQPVQPPPAPPPVSKLSPKLIIAAIFLLVLGASGGLILNKYLNNTKSTPPQNINLTPTSSNQITTSTIAPTIDPTTNWKTYTDNNNRYSFSYPSDWKLSSWSTPDGKVSVIVTFGVNGNDYTFSVNQAGTGGPEAEKIDNQLVVYGGKKFNRRTWSSGGKPFFISVIPAEPNFDLFNHIQILLPTKNTEGYLKTFDQILSTFKFLDQNSQENINTYTACGCGCCGGTTPVKKCLYHSKGDDLNKIIEDDKKSRQNPQCSTMGCSIGIEYYFCD